MTIFYFLFDVHTLKQNVMYKDIFLRTLDIPYNVHNLRQGYKIRQREIWCDFDLASSLICGNKMPTRCNRRLYCRSYCLLKPASILQTGHITLSSAPDQQLENHSTKYHRQQPLYNTLELLIMGIVVSETCWANNKICNKNLCCI